MIEILSTEYIEEVSWFLYNVKFTHEDYQIIFNGRYDGQHTEQQLLEKLQHEYDAWISRIQ